MKIGVLIVLKKFFFSFSSYLVNFLQNLSIFFFISIRTARHSGTHDQKLKQKQREDTKEFCTFYVANNHIMLQWDIFVKNYHTVNYWNTYYRCHGKYQFWLHVEPNAHRKLIPSFPLLILIFKWVKNREISGYMI